MEDSKEKHHGTITVQTPANGLGRSMTDDEGMKEGCSLQACDERNEKESDNVRERFDQKAKDRFDQKASDIKDGRASNLARCEGRNLLEIPQSESQGRFTQADESQSSMEPIELNFHASTQSQCSQHSEPPSAGAKQKKRSRMLNLRDHEHIFSQTPDKKSTEDVVEMLSMPELTPETRSQGQIPFMTHESLIKQSSQHRGCEQETGSCVDQRQSPMPILKSYTWDQIRKKSGHRAGQNIAIEYFHPPDQKAISENAIKDAQFIVSYLSILGFRFPELEIMLESMSHITKTGDVRGYIRTTKKEVVSRCLQQIDKIATLYARDVELLRETYCNQKLKEP